jgi:hypothetical protein
LPGNLSVLPSTRDDQLGRSCFCTGVSSRHRLQSCATTAMRFFRYSCCCLASLAQEGACPHASLNYTTYNIDFINAYSAARLETSVPPELYNCGHPFCSYPVRQAAFAQRLIADKSRAPHYALRLRSVPIRHITVRTYHVHLLHTQHVHRHHNCACYGVLWALTVERKDNRLAHSAEVRTDPLPSSVMLTLQLSAFQST